MHYYQSPKLIPVTRKMRLRLKAEQERTGKTPTALLKGRSDIPEGLTHKDVLNWLDMYGPAIKAFDSHINYIFDCYAEEVDKVRMSKKSTRVKITGLYLKQLNTEILRTGTPISELLNNAEDIPEGLTKNIVGLWRLKRTKTAFPEYLDFVLKSYQVLPTAVDVAPIEEEHNYKGRGDWEVSPRTYSKYRDLRNDNLMPISDEDLKALKTYQKVFGLLPGRILKIAKDKPKGLSSNMISNWLTGNVKNANPALLKWVLDKCREIQNLKV